MARSADGSPDKRTAPKGAGDPRDEFAALFERSFRSLWLVALGGTGNYALAEDVLQESAIVAFSKFDQYEAGTNFAAWMSRIVHFVARNQGRREQRRAALPIDAAYAAPATRAARDDSDDADLQSMTAGKMPADQQFFDDRLASVLRQLDETPRTCLLLRTLQGLEYSEISALLGIPEGTAMSHVHRTRKLLRDQLADLDPAARAQGVPPA